jgi:hypothetical protein
MCPLVVHPHLNGQGLIPTQVSLSATDVHSDGRWIRTGPTVQIEGGSYTLDGARQLRAALDDLLTLADSKTAS